MYKSQKQINKEFDEKFVTFLSAESGSGPVLWQVKVRDILSHISQIRQNDLNEIKESLRKKLDDFMENTQSPKQEEFIKGLAYAIAHLSSLNQ